MKKLVYLIVAAILICGSTVFSSCKDDDKDSLVVKIVVDPNRQEKIDKILDALEADLEAIDFKELMSLAESMRNDTITVNWIGVDSTGVQQILNSLQSLLDSLVTRQNSTTINQTYDFSNLSLTLQLADNVGKVFEKILNIYNLGDRIYSDSLDIVVSDTLTYKIKHSVELNSNVSLSGIGNGAHRKLIIEKNGTVLLVINTNQDFDASRNGWLINATKQVGSSLDYKDMKFSTVQTSYDNDSIVSSFVYNKGDSEVFNIRLKGENNLSLEKLLLNEVVYKGELEARIGGSKAILKSNVSNMNKFYWASIGLAGIGIAGSSKENCQKLADAFNDVVNSKLFLLNEEVGTLTVEPVVSDSGRYRPELILQPVGGGDKIILKDFLELMGISFQNIINSL